MYHIGGPQSTQRWPKLTRMYVLEIQNHLLALNAITQKLPKYHHGYTRFLHKLLLTTSVAAHFEIML